MNEIIKHIEKIDSIVEEREKNPSIAIKIAKRISYKALNALEDGAILFIAILSAVLMTITIALNAFNFLIISLVLSLGFIFMIIIIFTMIMDETSFEHEENMETLKKLKKLMKQEKTDHSNIMRKIIEKREKLPRKWWNELNNKISNYIKDIEYKKEIDKLLDFEKDENIETNLGINIKKSEDVVAKPGIENG